MKSSYIDNNALLGKSFLEKNYDAVNDWIMAQMDTLAICQSLDGSVYALDISRNKPLSDLYQDNFFVVRVVLKDVDTFHSDKQEKAFIDIFKQLENHMANKPGYYNLRLPTHFVDCLRAYNSIPKKNALFCGGTVEWIVKNKRTDFKTDKGTSVFWADADYIAKYKERLLEIAYKSFEKYQGQYHISAVTSGGAGKIYENWLQQSFENYQGKTVIVEYDRNPISFLLFKDTPFALEGVISAVDEDYRKYGAYKLMIKSGINHAEQESKAFVTSTQFDNFIVQGVWASLGLKPFYSIYNIHLDRRV